jgi:hypothetical protein
MLNRHQEAGRRCMYVEAGQRALHWLVISQTVRECQYG